MQALSASAQRGSGLPQLIPLPAAPADVVAGFSFSRALSEIAAYTKPKEEGAPASPAQPGVQTQKPPWNSPSTGPEPERSYPSAGPNSEWSSPSAGPEPEWSSPITRTCFEGGFAFPYPCAEDPASSDPAILNKPLIPRSHP